MSIGAPSLTISFAAGIWLEILALGSGGCGETWPTVTSASRKILSASACVLPTTSGTSILPLPTAISIATSEFFSAFSPAAGVWPMTVPGGASVDTFSFVVGLSLSSASVSFFSASNVDFAPVTSGTTTFLGRNRNRSSASRSSSGTSRATHHGSHALWRKTTWLGSSGIAAAGAAPPGALSFIRSTFLLGTLGLADARALKAQAAGADLGARARDAEASEQALGASACALRALLALLALGFTLGQLHVGRGLGLLGLFARSW